MHGRDSRFLDNFTDKHNADIASIPGKRSELITMAGMPCQKKKRKKGKADLTTVLHIRELPNLHMKLAVWFSFLVLCPFNPGHSFVCQFEFPWLNLTAQTNEW